MRHTLVAALLVWSIVSHAHVADVISGQVVGVHDGDTLTLLTSDKKQVKIRLSEIDAPEIGQPYGDKAKNVLSSLAFKKFCDATVATTDKYGRKIAAVTCYGKHVNREMVHAGAAWVYDDYPHTKIMELEESQAQNERRGLWALQDDQRIEPWRWRNGEREPLKPEPKQEFSCETKRCFALRCSHVTRRGSILRSAVERHLTLIMMAHRASIYADRDHSVSWFIARLLFETAELMLAILVCPLWLIATSSSLAASPSKSRILVFW